MNSEAKESKAQKIINICTLTVAFGFMLFMTALCPYLSDDYHFKFVWVDFCTNGSEKAVSSIGDIFESMKNYYMLSGGRVICHFVVYCLVNVNKWVYNILNALVFTAFVWLFYRQATRNIGEQKGLHVTLAMPMIMCSLLLFLPTVGDDMLWLSGSINYLWPATLLLFCARLIDDNMDKLTTKRAFLISIPILIGGGYKRNDGRYADSLYAFCILREKAYD